MDQPAIGQQGPTQHTAENRAHAAVLWQQARVWAARVPTKAWVVFVLFLLAAVLMAMHTAFVRKDASLRLKVQHSLRSAQLSIWVDGDLAYSGKLIGLTRKKFGLLPEVAGSLSETLPISSGTHQLRVRLASEDGTVQEDTISGEFDRNSQRTLFVFARRNDVSLGWQGAPSAMAEAGSSSTGWISRYAGTLLLTIAGSIISAVTGYAIRELPKQIAARQSEAPKV
jgi:hypothetical protein